MGNRILHVNCFECPARPSSIFCSLSKEEINDISTLKTVTAFRKKSVIFNQGSLPHGIFTVNSGKVKIYQITENGNEQIVRMAKRGDVLGYRALITGDKYTCTAEVIEDSNICFIPKSVFFDLSDKNASISGNLLKLLSHDLKRAESKITTLVEKPVRERLAEALLFLKETYGFEKDNITLNVVLTREEIANIVGTSKETAIRALAEFKEENLVQFEGKKIKIPSIRALANLACISDW
jgi:CRP/FNR family transcriptional regulator, polysaccharide utilization system transcription regulator